MLKVENALIVKIENAELSSRKVDETRNLKHSECHLECNLVALLVFLILENKSQA